MLLHVKKKGLSNGIVAKDLGDGVETKSVAGDVGKRAVSYGKRALGHVKQHRGKYAAGTAAILSNKSDQKANVALAKKLARHMEKQRKSGKGVSPFKVYSKSEVDKLR